jgi:hypothetical protein
MMKTTTVINVVIAAWYTLIMKNGITNKIDRGLFIVCIFFRPTKRCLRKVYGINLEPTLGEINGISPIATTDIEGTAPLTGDGM